MKGTIKTIVAGKPFGFISVEGQSSDVFFHQDKVVGGEATFRTLHENDVVTFETEENVGKDGQKRTNAINVQLA